MVDFSRLSKNPGGIRIDHNCCTEFAPISTSMLLLLTLITMLG
jgi:hypothetical protein